MENETEKVTRCPKCFGRDVRPSRIRGFVDGLMQKVHRVPYRCRGCQNRFYVYVARPKDPAEEETSLDLEQLLEEVELAENHAEQHPDDAVKPAE